MNKDEERSVNGDSALVPRDDQPGFFREVWQQARLVLRLILDPEVPIYLKVLPFAALVYLLLPFDFLPDVVPGLGQLDDLTIILVGAKVFIELAPQDIVARYLNQIRQKDGYSAIDIVDQDQSDAMSTDEGDIIDGIIIEGDVVEDE